MRSDILRNLRANKSPTTKRRLLKITPYNGVYVAQIAQIIIRTATVQRLAVCVHVMQCFGSVLSQFDCDWVQRLTAYIPIYTENATFSNLCRHSYLKWCDTKSVLLDLQGGRSDVWRLFTWLSNLGCFVQFVQIEHIKTAHETAIDAWSYF